MGVIRMRPMAGMGVMVGLALAAAACAGDDGSESSLSATTERETTSTSPSSSAGQTTTTVAGQVPLDDLELTLTEVASVDSPTSLVTRPGTNALYVVERAGEVREITVTGSGADRRYEVSDEPLLDISDDVVTDVEQGLLDAEFSPDGSALYVHYSLAPGGDTRIDGYTMDGDAVNTSSRREILAVEQPYANHNGGEIEFGPDGYLYIGLGDGGDAGDPHENGQNTDALLGKILRIDPENPSGGREYGIPEDNPFADGSGGAPEVWMYGLRNPWRFAFDPATDDLWVSDVGQEEWEEINVLPAADGSGRAANLGWNLMEGTHEFADDAPEGHVAPVFEYDHGQGCSITGGFVYRGSAIPGLAGAYLYTDYCQSDLRAIRVAGGAVTEDRVFGGATSDEIVSFGQDAEGEVYALSLGGSIYRIDAAG
jgi:glucose/arabinose dehydrogenase